MLNWRDGRGVEEGWEEGLLEGDFLCGKTATRSVSSDYRSTG